MKTTLKLITCVALCVLMVFAAVSCSGGDTDTVVVPEGTKNAVVVRYEKQADNKVVATVSIEGDVAYAAVAGTLNYDKNVLTYVSHEAVDCANVNNKEAGVLAFSQANSTNYTAKQTLFKVTFTYTGTADTTVSFTFDEGNFVNAQFADVEYTVIGATLKLS